MMCSADFEKIDSIGRKLTHAKAISTPSGSCVILSRATPANLLVYAYLGSNDFNV